MNTITDVANCLENLNSTIQAAFDWDTEYETLKTSEAEKIGHIYTMLR